MVNIDVRIPRLKLRSPPGDFVYWHTILPACEFNDIHDSRCERPDWKEVEKKSD